MGCDAYEVQLEQEAHGALDPALQPGLAAHREGCASCRAFAALVAQVDGGLAARAREAASAIDWPRVEREVAAQTFMVRWVMPGLLTGLGLFASSVLAVRHPERPEWVAPFAAFWLVVAAAAWWLSRSWLRQWERGAGAGADLLDFHRRWLAHRTRDARQALVTCIAVGLAVPALPLIGPPATTLAEHLALWAAPIVCLSAAVYLAAVDLPRLRREREALD